MISYYLENNPSSKGKVSIDEVTQTYKFDYPCESYSDCTEYVIHLSPGLYKFELFGASGGACTNRTSLFMNSDGNCTHREAAFLYGGNAVCRQIVNRGGAGGYISGIIKILHKITAFATIGGKGIHTCTRASANQDSDYYPSNMVKGGYGGGGWAANWYWQPGNNGAGSGGGQTAVMFLQNDLWHRVIVSGGGGGSDNCPAHQTEFMGADDGSGGAGGGFTAQGFWINGELKSSHVANSTYGFSFGSGESAQKDGSKNQWGVKRGEMESDRPGSGSGWFGGFAGHHGDGGSGGGSSWVLSKNAVIPPGEIQAYDSFYNPIGKHPYAFLNHEY
ncbi:glycine-rich protein family, partial [Trichomonas vaginalis G3]